MSEKFRKLSASVLALAMMANVTAQPVQTIIAATETQQVLSTEDRNDLPDQTIYTEPNSETFDGDYLRGDVDLDGKVTQVDATIILREALLSSTGSNSVLEELISEEGKKKFPENYIEVSHRNGDVDNSDNGSKFTQTDATFILRVLLETSIKGETSISDSTWNRNIDYIKEENDMATQDINANIHIKDENGNVNNIFPATKISNVEGLQTALNSKANSSDVTSGLAGKVDKETGKGLSTNDYTTTEKNKLSGIEAQANKTDVDSALSSSSTNPVQNKVINTALSGKADAATVTALEGRVTDVETEQTALDARMDTFTHLSEGSTTGDAELTDIRVKADGTLANSAGTAVRTQITDVNHNLNSLQDRLYVVDGIIPAKLERGNITMSTTSLVYSDSTTRLRTPQNDGVLVKKGDVIRLSTYEGANFYISVNDSEGHYITSGGWLTSDYTVTADGIAYVLARFNPETTINVGDLEVTIISHDNVINTVDGNSLNISSIGIPISKYTLESGSWSSGSKASSAIRIRTKTKLRVHAGQVLHCIPNGLYYNLVVYESESSSRIVDYTDWVNTDHRISQDGYATIQIANGATYDSSTTISVDDFTAQMYISYDMISKSDVDEMIRSIAIPISKLSLERGSWSDGSKASSVKRIRTKEKIHVYAGQVLQFIPNGLYYNLVVYSTDSSTNIVDYANWTNKNHKITKEGYATIQIANAESYDESTEITVDDFNASMCIANDTDSELKELESVSLNANRFKPLYHHLFVNDRGADVVIPHQSIADIRIAKRLGFNMIEANVQVSSDGVYYANHGDGGNFGDYVYDINGTDISTTPWNSVSSTYIDNNIRYYSSIDKYKTRPTKLSEFLIECRKNDMIPMITCTSKELAAFIESYMGKSNYVAYNATRSICKSYISNWYWDDVTKETIVDRAEQFGLPFIYGWGNIKNYEDSVVRETISELHSKGFLVASAYLTSAQLDKYMSMGLDIVASTESDVNRLENGNICNFSTEVNWNDFNLTGATLSNGVVTINANDNSITPNISATVQVGIYDIDIWFSGTITIDGLTYTSDGSTSTRIAKRAITESVIKPITGAIGTVVYDINYKASRV